MTIPLVFVPTPCTPLIHSEKKDDKLTTCRVINLKILEKKNGREKTPTGNNNKSVSHFDDSYWSRFINHYYYFRHIARASYLNP